MPSGIELIAAERQRQIEKEGWTAEHDEQHAYGELAMAAALYASPKQLYEMSRDGSWTVTFSDPWPWWDEKEGPRGGSFTVPAWDKRKKHNRLRRLVIAGALIAAEIDRLQRMNKEEPLP